MNQDVAVLRKLAGKYLAASKEDRNHQRLLLHRASNSLRMERPVVLIEELPWFEMNVDDQLTLQCQNPSFRAVEDWFRKKLYQYKYFPADMILQPYVPIPKRIQSTGIGIKIEEETLSTDATNHIVSHEYRDLLSDPEALDRVHPATISYDAEDTNRRFQLIGDAIGDMIPLRKTGINHLSMQPWDDISTYRGVTPLLIDLMERPEFSHAIMRKLVDIGLGINEQYLALGLFDNNPWSLHCTPIAVDGLIPDDFSGEHTSFDTIWGRGTAQIFASVSKDMHEEFDIDYMIDSIGKCGLVYYGCCEPLDKKLDIVEKIPNLRKISVTPWADVDVATEIIGDRYVVASKPNPASVAVPLLDETELRKEIGAILSACKRNNCSVDIVLKDISTCSSRPENIYRWEEIVMEMVENY